MSVWLFPYCIPVDLVDVNKKGFITDGPIEEISEKWMGRERGGGNLERLWVPVCGVPATSGPRYVLS